MADRPKSWRDYPYIQRVFRVLNIGEDAPRDQLQRALENIAAGFDAPLLTRTIPAGCLTYSCQVNLDSDQSQSDRVPVRFNEPVMLVGVFFVVLPGTFPPPNPPNMPGLDDLEVMLDWNQAREYATARLDVFNQANTSRGVGFTSLSGMDIRNRILMKLFPDTNGEAAITIRSAYSDENGSNLGIDVTVKAHFICKPCSDYMADRVG